MGRCCVCILGAGGGGGSVAGCISIITAEPKMKCGKMMLCVYWGGVGGAGCISITTAEPKMKCGKKPCMNEKSSYLTYQAVYRQCFVLQSLVEPCACVCGGGGVAVSPVQTIYWHCIVAEPEIKCGQKLPLQLDEAGWGCVGVHLSPNAFLCVTLFRSVPRAHHSCLSSRSVPGVLSPAMAAANMLTV